MRRGRGSIAAAGVKSEVGVIVPSMPNLAVAGRRGLPNKGYSAFSCLYGSDAFCKLLVRDVKTVCTHVSGLLVGRLPKHARSLDEIRAPRP